jgi:hypothetical protein
MGAFLIANFRDSRIFAKYPSHLVFVNLYDLCKTCVESNTANGHEHEDFEVILADKEDEDCDEEKK